MPFLTLGLKKTFYKCSVLYGLRNFFKNSCLMVVQRCNINENTSNQVVMAAFLNHFELFLDVVFVIFR